MTTPTPPDAPLGAEAILPPDQIAAYRMLHANVRLGSDVPCGCAYGRCDVEDLLDSHEALRAQLARQAPLVAAARAVVQARCPTRFDTIASAWACYWCYGPNLQHAAACPWAALAAAVQGLGDA